MPGAPGHHGQGAAVPAHLLPPLPGEHRQLQERAPLPGVPHPGGVRGGRAARQHPPGSAPGRDQAAAAAGGRQQAVPGRGVAAGVCSRDVSLPSGHCSQRAAGGHQELPCQG